ncbi:hypothetical protein BKA65DRAFT_118001 [Rhexocercosporidium sp. MPI-PUGE-AT-0058]|nr:hypothetical protein BKA65DRAFT_118001 [Rhexocercosporidium sp. MPI-PUGE-AT-0058]
MRKRLLSYPTVHANHYSACILTFTSFFSLAFSPWVRACVLVARQTGGAQQIINLSPRMSECRGYEERMTSLASTFKVF